MDFFYRPAEVESGTVVIEAGFDQRLAAKWLSVAAGTPNRRESGSSEGASTRIIIHARPLNAAGVGVNDAIRPSMTRSLTDDPNMREAPEAVITVVAGWGRRRRGASRP